MKTKLQLMAAGLAMSVSLGLDSPAQAGDPYNGVHQVISYKSQRFIAIKFPSSGGLNLRFYRARGGLWQEWGSTRITGKKSDGSIRQNIWFKGRKAGRVHADLRSEFYLYRPENVAF